MSQKLRPIPITLDRPNIIEQWAYGSYVVTALFPIVLEGGAGAPTSLETIQTQGQALLEEAKRLKKGFWPRGIATFHLIPIYILPTGEFSEALRRQVYNNSQYWKYAIYLDPVLCELEPARVTLRYGFENPRFMFTKFFMRVLLSALTEIGKVHAPPEITRLDVNVGTLSLPLAPRPSPGVT